MNQIHEAIQKLRLTLSQSEIARQTGIAQSKISRWESGEVPASASDALKLIALAKKLPKTAPQLADAATAPVRAATQQAA